MFEDLREVDVVKRLSNRVLLLLDFLGPLLLSKRNLAAFQGSGKIRALLVSDFAEVVISLGLFLLSYRVESINNLHICLIIYGLPLIPVA